MTTLNIEKPYIQARGMLEKKWIMAELLKLKIS